jgi:hypothetical protein
VTYNSSFNVPDSAVLQSTCPAEVYGAGTYTPCTTTVTNNDLGSLALPGPTTNLPPVELRFIQNNIRTAQTQFWSLAMRRELARNTVMEISYSGAHGVHLYDLNNVTLPGAGQIYLGDPVVGAPSYTGETCNPAFAAATGACLTPPNSQYAAINHRGSGGSSAYDAMNIKFQSENLTTPV